MTKLIKLKSGHSFEWRKDSNYLELNYEYEGGSEGMEFHISKEGLKDIKKFFKQLKWNKNDKR